MQTSMYNECMYIASNMLFVVGTILLKKEILTAKIARTYDEERA